MTIHIQRRHFIIADRFRRTENKPWGMCEFAMSDPDEILVRVGWPSSLRKSPLTVISARRGI
jgi:hypothetical protein